MASTSDRERGRGRYGRKRIAAPDGSDLTPSSGPQPDGTLIKALVRAWRWQRMLGASIPASEIYAAAGVVMISPAPSNPLLTELGRANVFRLENRDDPVGNFCSNYLADHWSDRKIAIPHDNIGRWEG